MVGLFCLSAGGQQSLGVRSCLPQKHTEQRRSLDPGGGPDGYGRSAQILSRPGHNLGWALKPNPC